MKIFNVSTFKTQNSEWKIKKTLSLITISLCSPQSLRLLTSYLQLRPAMFWMSHCITFLSVDSKMGLSHGKVHSEARLDGKTAVITGCNTGIGKVTALRFTKIGKQSTLWSFPILTQYGHDTYFDYILFLKMNLSIAISTEYSRRS